MKKTILLIIMILLVLSGCKNKEEKEIKIFMIIMVVIGIIGIGILWRMESNYKNPFVGCTIDEMKVNPNCTMLYSENPSQKLNIINEDEEEIMIYAGDDDNYNISEHNLTCMHIKDGICLMAKDEDGRIGIGTNYPTNCHQVPCPQNRSGCLVYHTECD